MVFLKEGKRWANSKVITCYFMEGSETQRYKVEREAKRWELYQSIRFNFTNDPRADVRIKFVKNGGSWSRIGTDCLAVPVNQHTLNFSWLTDSTSDADYRRAVLHEFGHVLGAEHELQSPANNIKWNKDAVYRYFTGPPCNWSRSYVDVNIFTKCPAEKHQYTLFDPKSIMTYPVPKNFTLDGFSIDWASDLSDLDKSFIATIYP